MAETKNFMAKLVRAWPALPYMALGALLASVYIASSGTAWLSDSEINGGNLSVLTVTMSLSAGGLMLLSTFAVPRVRSWLERPTACLWAGAVSSLGALIVILIGPYYLTPMLPYPVIRSLFFIGGILFGVGLGAIALRCGQLYGALPPRQVILYVAYSQFVVGASFFIVLGSPAWAPVPGGPSLAGMASFVLLPLAAGILASFSRHIEQPTPTLVRDHSRRSLPKSFWKLLAVVFVFSCIVSSVYASTVAVSSIETTLSSVVFELFLWCILAFTVFQRRTSAVIVFGYGYGAYQLGNGIGWLFGAQLLGTLFGAVGEAFAYMIMALIVLACAFLIFSEREFDRLFAPGEEGAPSLDELLMRDLAAESEGPAREDEPVRKGRFGLAIEALAADYQLSPRETDVLRCLAMGYNSSTTASKLSISWNTVRTHTRNVYGKLGVHSQQELIAMVDDVTAAEG